MADHYEKNHAALAHEIWAAAQLAPGEGIVDGVARVEALLRKDAHHTIAYLLRQLWQHPTPPDPGHRRENDND